LGDRRRNLVSTQGFGHTAGAKTGDIDCSNTTGVITTRNSSNLAQYVALITATFPQEEACLLPAAPASRLLPPDYLLPEKPFSPYYLSAFFGPPMRLLSSIFAGVIVLTGFSSALAQGPKEPEQAEAEPAMIIHLVDGRRMQVDDVRESAEGFWYRNGTLTTLLDKARVKKIEQVAPPANNPPLADTASESWSIKDSHKVENFFASKFQRRLPATAFGQSELHTRWGLDHRNGIDVGLHPESLEGRALINFLRNEKIPFLAFRSAIPGVATGPHIHIGRGSHRTSRRSAMRSVASGR
jgi:hypothetical protein